MAEACANGSRYPASHVILELHRTAPCVTRIQEASIGTAAAVGGSGGRLLGSRYCSLWKVYRWGGLQWVYYGNYHEDHRHCDGVFYCPGGWLERVWSVRGNSAPRGFCVAAPDCEEAEAWVLQGYCLASRC